MTGLGDKSVAELETLAADLRAELALQVPRSPVQQIALEDVEWEIEKRRWRKDL
ncbi:MAG: hypothetical protein JO187_00785 [Acidobacteria bacterium]|nr:hypothetical protein [Acidobacteriota bacterium]